MSFSQSELVQQLELEQHELDELHELELELDELDEELSQQTCTGIHGLHGLPQGLPQGLHGLAVVILTQHLGSLQHFFSFSQHFFSFLQHLFFL